MSLKEEFNRAVALGWAPFFEEASLQRGIPKERIWAIASRETDLDPKYLKEKGDNGHGHGLMQIDDRSFPTWCKQRDPKDPSRFIWQDARYGILKGADILKTKMTVVRALVIRGYCYIHGIRYDIKERPTPDIAATIAIAGYNAGEGNALRGYIEGNIDKYTKHGTYSADVLEREKIFKELVDAPKT